MSALIACPEAEAAVLGAAMLTPARAAETLGELLVEDFTDPRHGDVFEAVRFLVEAGVTPEPVAVLGQLRTAGTLPSTADRGPGNLLHDLMAACALPGAAPTYRQILLEHTFRRSAARAFERVAQMSEAGNLTDLVDLIQDELSSVGVALQRITK